MHAPPTNPITVGAIPAPSSVPSLHTIVSQVNVIIFPQLDALEFSGFQTMFIYITEKLWVVPSMIMRVRLTA